MSEKEKDEYGNRMKAYEKSFDFKIDKNKPIVVRIDGKRFSKFTKKMEKPFDSRMRSCMQEVAQKFAKEFNANIAYTQSDETTFIFLPNEEGVVLMPFDYRIQKLVSVFSSAYTTYFIREYDKHFNDCGMPKFDCRIFNVDDEVEACNALYWRIVDAKKNAVSSIYRYTFGHKKMQNKNAVEMKAELVDSGCDFLHIYNKYATSGSLYQKNYDTKINENGEEYKRSSYKMVSGEDFPKNICDKLEFFQKTKRTV